LVWSISLSILIILPEHDVLATPEKFDDPLGLYRLS